MHLPPFPKSIAVSINYQDNPKVKSGLNAKGKDIIEAWEIIDAVLMGGEKYTISEIIDDISGYNNDEKLELEQYAKN